MNDALLRVATGLRMVFWGLMTMIVAGLIMAMGVCILAVGAAQAQQAVKGGAGAGAGGGAGPMAFLQGAIVFLVAVGLVYLVGFILDLVGRILCLACPPEAGAAKALVVVSVVLQLLGLGSNIANTADNAGGNFLPIELKIATAVIGAVCGLTAFVLFVLFIRSLALFIDRRDLAGRALAVIWVGVAAVGFYIAGIAIAFAGGAAAGAGPGGGPGGGAGPGAAMAGGCVGLLFMLGGLLLGLVAVVLYAILLLSTSNGLKQYVREGDSGDYEDDYGDDDDDRDRDRDDYDGPDDRDDDRRGGDRPWDRGGR